MFGLGSTELIIIFLIVVIFFGVGKLPEIGSGLGKAIKNFKKTSSEEEKENESIKPTGNGENRSDDGKD